MGGEGERLVSVALDPNSCTLSRTIGKGSRARLRWERKRKRHPESLTGNASCRSTIQSMKVGWPPWIPLADE